MMKRNIYLYIKRFLDIVLSFTAIVVLMPLYLIIAILVRIEDGGKILYRQERVGRGEKIFSMYKFRSMLDRKREVHQQTFHDSPEVTKIGAFIRRYKIDELPQLFNVLKGDLSIIGPRPCLPETLSVFGEKSKLRHTVRPGLSGLSQINGNVYLSWPERLNYDLQYVNNISFFLDITILMKTLYLIIVGEEKGVTKI